MTYQRFGTPTTDTDSELVESEVTESEREERLHHEPNYDDRSLVFTGLSSATTLLDITTVVRGGAILNVFITTSGTTAHVSFVKSLAAHAFHQHAKRQDIYIKDKLVTVDWSEQQSFIPAHLARQIQVNKASRNLIILFPTPEMTADAIREDLEHIHNLHVVDIRVELRRVFIHTNSIWHAMTARDCMMSRLKYKKAKIDFYADECDQVLPASATRFSEQKSLPAANPWARHSNRFGSLHSQSEDSYLEE